MKPNQIAKESEASQQQAFFAYCAFATKHGFEHANEWAFDELPKLNTKDAWGRPPQRRWVNLINFSADLVPELAWIHAIPNGGSRGDSVKSRQIRGAQLKAEGVKDGVSDIFWPFKTRTYSGLYIEMKRPALKPKRTEYLDGVKYKLAGLKPNQVNFKFYVEGQGFFHVVCYSWIEAVEVLNKYYQTK